MRRLTVCFRKDSCLYISICFAIATAINSLVTSPQGISDISCSTAETQCQQVKEWQSVRPLFTIDIGQANHNHGRMGDNKNCNDKLGRRVRRGYAVEKTKQTKTDPCCSQDWPNYRCPQILSAKKESKAEKQKPC